MQPLNVIIATSDPQAASQMAASLHQFFRSVSVARSLDEARHAIPKHRAELAIVDLELASMKDVAALCHEFGNMKVVCTHRVPDEEMWTEALAAGAIDCCYKGDVTAIVQAVRRDMKAIGKANAA